MLVAAAMAFCGMIHSPLPDEQVGLPWDVLAKMPEGMREAVACQTPWHWTAAYLLSAALLGVLGLAGKGRVSAEQPGKMA